MPAHFSDLAGAGMVLHLRPVRARYTQPSAKKMRATPTLPRLKITRTVVVGTDEELPPHRGASIITDLSIVVELMSGVRLASRSASLTRSRTSNTVFDSAIIKLNALGLSFSAQIAKNGLALTHVRPSQQRSSQPSPPQVAHFTAQILLSGAVEEVGVSIDNVGVLSSGRALVAAIVALLAAVLFDAGTVAAG